VSRAGKIAKGKQYAEAKVAELRRCGVRLSKSDIRAIRAQLEKNFEIVSEKMGRS
jgi:hypothetical protein